MHKGKYKNLYVRNINRITKPIVKGKYSDFFVSWWICNRIKNLRETILSFRMLVSHACEQRDGTEFHCWCPHHHQNNRIICSISTTGKSLTSSDIQHQFRFLFLTDHFVSTQSLEAVRCCILVSTFAVSIQSVTGLLGN